MWNQKPDERLREWKTFRRNISQLTLQEACDKTSHLWSYAPFVNHYLDSDKNSSATPWPNPWELLHDNYYCDIAKALGMLYTLCLSNHQPENIHLLICQDSVTRQAYNLVSVLDGKYVLNFEFDSVVNNTQLPASLIVHASYTPKDLDLDQY